MLYALLMYIHYISTHICLYVYYMYTHLYILLDLFLWRSQTYTVSLIEQRLSNIQMLLGDVGHSSMSFVK